MSTQRKTKKGRKRKQPDSFNEDTPTSEPRSKRRKLSHPPHNKKRTGKTTTNKSQSISPKKSNAKSPFKNITIPSVSLNNNNSGYIDSSSEDESESESANLFKYNTIRSQPSTPIRNKIRDMKDMKEPHSQSAKRSKTHRKYININHNKYTRDSSLSPPPALTNTYKKSMPGLFASQESEQFSPQKKPQIRAINVQITPKRNINFNNSHSVSIPVNATPVRTNNILQTDNYNKNHNNRNRNYIQKYNTQPISQRYVQRTGSSSGSNANKNLDLKWWNNDIFYILLFIVIGFISGFGVAIGVNGNGKTTAKRTTTTATATMNNNNNYNIIDNDMCTCDIDNNKTSRHCSPCMDKYWTLKSECDIENNVRLKQERDMLLIEKNKLENELENNDNGCILRLNKLQNEMIKCNNLMNGLQNKIELLKNGNVCEEYTNKIGELEHELGECNVEWGSCEQLGRQKDKLDEKRLEEIKKQKKKFTLCNEQLKRYKEKTRANKNKGK